MIEKESDNLAKTGGKPSMVCKTERSTTPGSSTKHCELCQKDGHLSKQCWKRCTDTVLIDPAEDRVKEIEMMKCPESKKDCESLVERNQLNMCIPNIIHHSGISVSSLLRIPFSGRNLIFNKNLIN